MRVVLYTEEMEPITVLELRPFAIDLLETRGRVRLHVMEPIRSYADLNPDTATIKIKTVDIWGEVFIRKGRRQMFLFTDDEEAALMLRSELLPGQRKDVQEAQRRSYAAGFLKALEMLGDNL